MTNPDILKNPIRVSVIIPVFNVEEYLSKCLDSLYQQTLRPEEFEIIIIDDNSSDETLKIAKNFKKKRNNVIVLHNQKNLGPGLSRNKGLDIAKGEYVYFVDGDDYIDPTTLERLLIYSYDQDADIVTSGFYRVTVNGDIIFKKIYGNQYLTNKVNWMRNILNGTISSMACNRLIRKNLFIDHDITFPDFLHEDVAIMYKLFFVSKVIVNYPEYLYYWVQRVDSRTSSISEGHIDGYFNAISSREQFVLSGAGEGFWSKVSSSSDLGFVKMVNLFLTKIIEASPEKNDLLSYLYSRTIDFDRGIERINTQGGEYKYVNKFITVFGSNKNNEKAVKEFLSYVKEEKMKTLSKNKDVSYLGALNSRNIFIRRFSKIIQFIKLFSRYRSIDRKIEYASFRVNHFLKKRRLNLNAKNKKLMRNKFSQDINSFKVVFFCDANYHIRNAIPIIRALGKEGIKACILDYSKYLSGGRRKLSQNELEKVANKAHLITFQPWMEEELPNIQIEVGVFFNDWAQNHNNFIRKLRLRDIKTLSIVEGVSDFLKLSEGFTRKISPYRTVEHVFLPGEFETQFFKDRPGQYHIVGLPMIRKLYKEEVNFPKKPLAVINVNFTYGVLTWYRNLFVKTAVEGCKLAGIDYVITQHPMDNADLSEYNVTDKNMYDTIREGSIFISRFSGAIIESLAMGKPCVYHNPHDEKMIKFQEPMGAYSISDSAESLAKAIKYELDRSSKTPVREYSRKFMEYHANIHSKKEPEQLITEIIMKLIKS